MNEGDRDLAREIAAEIQEKNEARERRAAVAIITAILSAGYLVSDYGGEYKTEQSVSEALAILEEVERRTA